MEHSREMISDGKNYFNLQNPDRRVLTAKSNTPTMQSFVLREVNDGFI